MVWGALLLPCVPQAHVWHCLLNGFPFLGCILWWTLALAPAVEWLASRFISPCWAPCRADALANAMRLIFDVLLPSHSKRLMFLRTEAWMHVASTQAGIQPGASQRSHNLISRRHWLRCTDIATPA